MSDLDTIFHDVSCETGKEMTMKLPKRLKIGGHEFEVEFPYDFKERGDVSGQMDWGDLSIRVCGTCGGGSKRKDSTVWVSFFHEILHACDFLSGHQIFHENEPAIDGISEALYQVLVDNDLLKFPE